MNKTFAACAALANSVANKGFSIVTSFIPCASHINFLRLALNEIIKIFCGVLLGSRMVVLDSRHPVLAYCWRGLSCCNKIMISQASLTQLARTLLTHFKLCPTADWLQPAHTRLYLTIYWLQHHYRRTMKTCKYVWSLMKLIVYYTKDSCS